MPSSQIEILHVIGSFVAGGAERFVVSLVRELKKSGLSVAVLALSAKTDEVGIAMCASLKLEGIPYYIGPTKKVRFLSAFWYIKKLFDTKPKLVHLHTSNTELAHYIGMKIYRKKHFLFRTVHFTRIPTNRWYKFAMLNNNVDLSIMCSHAVESTFSKVIKGKFITVQNGVEFNWPIQSNELRNEYKKKLGLSVDIYHVLNTGRQSGETLVDGQKAHDILISAWRKAHLADHGCQLNLIGDGNLSVQLMELAKGDKSIVFHGIKSNIHEWLLAADCFVMPSRSEGLPIAGIEAIGTGLPCVFTDIEPLKELDPSVVLWVPVGDVEQLSRKLIEMKEANLDDDVSTASKIRNRFGIKKVAKIYGDNYNSYM